MQIRIICILLLFSKFYWQNFIRSRIFSNKMRIKVCFYKLCYSDTVPRYFVILHFFSFILGIFHYQFYEMQHSVNMVDGIVKVISKPEFLAVSHTDFYSHISLLAEFDNSSSTETMPVR